LLEGWEKTDGFGYDEANLDRDTGYGWMPENKDGSLMHPECPEYSPILVLHNCRLTAPGPENSPQPFFDRDICSASAVSLMYPLSFNLRMEHHS